MARTPRHNSHDRYKSRITSLFQSYGIDSTPESQAHNAKYLAVLVSGYLEQAIKELLLRYVPQGTRSQISRYIEETWPTSRNMSADNIEKVLNQFNTSWGQDFSVWLEEGVSRKNDINSIVRWRNSIAHGQESNTTGVTLVSVRNAFSTIKELVSFVEEILNREGDRR